VVKVQIPEKHPSGAKAHHFVSGIYGTTKEVAEKGLLPSKMPEKHTSGAKAHVDSIGFIPGINPRPTARMSFSAACKVVPFQNLTFTTGC
jgi:hypothetical protein